MQWDEYPRWIRIVGAVRLLLMCAVLIGLGVSYIVWGHTAGQLVGAALVAIAAAGILLIAVSPIAKRFARPS